MHTVFPEVEYVPEVQAIGNWSTAGQAYPAGQTVQVVELAKAYVPGDDEHETGVLVLSLH